MKDQDVSQSLVSPSPVGRTLRDLQVPGIPLPYRDIRDRSLYMRATGWIHPYLGMHTIQLLPCPPSYPHRSAHHDQGFPLVVREHPHPFSLREIQPGRNADFSGDPVPGIDQPGYLTFPIGDDRFQGIMHIP